jgi:hypothetical protein
MWKECSRWPALSVQHPNRKTEISGLRLLVFMHRGRLCNDAVWLQNDVLSIGESPAEESADAENSDGAGVRKRNAVLQRHVFVVPR